MSQRTSRGGWSGPEFLGRLAFAPIAVPAAHQLCRPGVIMKLLREGLIKTAYHQTFFSGLRHPPGPGDAAREAAQAVACAIRVYVLTAPEAA